MYSIYYYEHRVVIQKENKLDKTLLRIILLTLIFVMNIIYFLKLEAVTDIFFDSDEIKEKVEFGFDLTKLWLGIQLIPTLLFINFSGLSLINISINTFKKQIIETRDYLFWKRRKRIPFTDLKWIVLEKDKYENYLGFLIIGKKKYLIEKDTFKQRIEKKCFNLAKKLTLEVESCY